MEQGLKTVSGTWNKHLCCINQKKQQKLTHKIPASAFLCWTDVSTLSHLLKTLLSFMVFAEMLPEIPCGFQGRRMRAFARDAHVHVLPSLARVSSGGMEFVVSATNCTMHISRYCLSKTFILTI